MTEMMPYDAILGESLGAHPVRTPSVKLLKWTERWSLKMSETTRANLHTPTATPSPPT